MKLEHILHLYHRAGFGISPEAAELFVKKKRKQVIDILFKAAAENTPLKIPTPEIDTYLASPPAEKDPKRFRELLKKSRNKQKTFNQAWIQRMGDSKAELRERMTLFWANHFVCRHRNIVYIQHFNNTLRTHALGNFRDFVLAISKEAAMLDYLNNQQNRKGRPNENFARELMELFTLGVGNYTEADVKAAARAFTGWRHDLSGNFRIAKKQHDWGNKTFLGRTGNFNGEDIIDILLENPACSLFISRKLYRYFVNDEVHEPHVKEMAQVFRKNYEIKEVMYNVFNSDWFYEKQNIRTKIKSPMDFLVGVMRVVPFSFDKVNELLYVQKLLGQVLLVPPNVAGWPGGRSWIDTNTLMARLKLPSVILKEGTIAFDVKGEFEDSPDSFEKRNNYNRRLSITKRWDIFKRNFQGLSQEELSMYLLGSMHNEGTVDFLNTLEKEDFTDFCIQLMSLPEYQLC
ncbi:MAG: DUF1800 domain-containing protein [Saonia sp.]